MYTHLHFYLRSTLLIPLLFFPLLSAASPSEETSKTVLYPDPFLSTRAAGMGGALSTLADGVDAPFYNPAGIGGLHWEKTTPPAIRQLNLPYVGAGLNTKTTSLNHEFSQEGAKSNSDAADTILRANEGKRQYARTSGLLTLGYNRLILLQALDYQVAAFRKAGEAADGNNLQAAYRNQSSTGIGFSAVNSTETFYLGIYTAYQHRTEFAGALNYATLTTPSTRSHVLSQEAASTFGTATNAGMLWVLGPKSRPALAVVVNNIGGTQYTGSSHAAGSSETQDPETITVGASISPRIGTHGSFNWIFEGQDLTNQAISVGKKWRTGMEITWGGFGSEGWLGLRVGYNPTGFSGGINLNFGLLQFEFASSVQDIGLGNYIVAERRNLAVISVNAREDVRAK